MLLEIMDLAFEYPPAMLASHAQGVLHQVSWQLPAGGVLHIQGANGSGKTTLLKCLAGILRPTRGSIHYAGADIQLNLPAFQQQLCYVGHKTGISAALTVIENCLYDLHTPSNISNLEELLHQAALWEVKDLPGYLLSAGQKRRVGLLRLQLSPAKLWLLDEPLVALDEAGMTLLIRWLQTHVAAGGQVVYSSHHPLPAIQAPQQVYRL